MYQERVAGLALVASHVAEDASRKASADPVQRELAVGRDTLAAQLERDGTSRRSSSRVRKTSTSNRSRCARPPPP
jgi:hypothetical protein